jgi:glutathione peroxidase
MRRDEFRRVTAPRCAPPRPVGTISGNAAGPARPDMESPMIRLIPRPMLPALAFAFTVCLGASAAWAADAAKPAPATLAAPASKATACPAFIDQTFTRLRSSERLNLCKAFAGKPLLIVNTASHCGFTDQFEGLEALHQKYRARGLVVIGFPSDDFHQEASSEAEVADVCFVNYGVKFPMLAPSVVTGGEANPVFRELARQTREPRWNFNKYLVSPDGKVVGYYGSTVKPDSKELTAAIEKLL